MEYFLGDYASPICSLYGMLEEVGNPHYDLDATKCKDFTIKLTPFPKDDNAFTRYKWYKENEEILNQIFNRVFEDEFEKYISRFCNISDI